MTDTQPVAIADLCAAAVATRNDPSDASIYMADLALAQAQAEQARIEADRAQARANRAHIRIIAIDSTAQYVDDETDRARQDANLRDRYEQHIEDDQAPDSELIRARHLVALAELVRDEVLASEHDATD